MRHRNLELPFDTRRLEIHQAQHDQAHTCEAIIVTPAERRVLIESPITSRRFPGKTWGGVNLGNAGAIPEAGQRITVYEELAKFDESYIRYGTPE